ncbi:MAG: hypothetical protein NC331_09260 [Lachnospiraceae bacterium]|nr:hypothetical protein [Lachnospiraceae bacterium]MCM1239559.1 hypothetical protein [Lachnospiraceae bacterium]
MKIRYKIKLVMITAFMAVLILPPLAWGILRLISLKNPAVMEKLDYNLGENRNKASFPESFDLNEYPKQLEAYYNDRAPFRSVLIRWNQKFSGKLEAAYQADIEPALIAWLYGNGGSGNAQTPSLPPALPEGTAQPEQTPENKPSATLPPADGHDYLVVEQTPPTCVEEGNVTYRCGDCGNTYTEALPAAGHTAETEVVEPSYTNYGYTVYSCTVCGKTWRDDFVAKPLDDSYFPPKQAGDYTILGRYNWLFYRGNATLSYYRGTNILTEEEMADYLAILQQLQDVCDEKGIRLCFMVFPNKEEVYDEYMPTYQIANTPRRDERLAAYIVEHSDIDFVYPLEELRAGKICYDMYYQYDSHWNNAGGFVGAQALYEALGMPVTDFADWNITQTAGAPTGLIATGGLDPANYPEDHDYAIDYRPEVRLTNTEGEKSILCASGIYRAWSDCDNDRKLVFVGDSFRAAMLPYLEKDFAEICAAHRDEKQDIKQDIKQADVLVVAAVERFDRTIFEVAQVLTGYLRE